MLATDIAPALLAYAELDAQAATLGNIVATQGIDGEALTSLPAASFDIAVSRVRMIYFPDQQRARAGMKHAPPNLSVTVLAAVHSGGIRPPTGLPVDGLHGGLPM